MTSSRPGTSTSDVEVTNIDSHGIWVLLLGGEYLLPYEEYPWFGNAKIGDILDVRLLHGRHLRWEALDVDLSVETLGDPKAYPLIYK